MKKQPRNAWSGIMKSTLIGVVVSLVGAVAVCAIGAALVAGGQLQESAMGYVCAAALLLSGILGGLIAVAGKESGRLLLCALHGAAFFLALLCGGILLFDTAAQGVGGTALMCLGSSVAAALLTMKKKGRRTPSVRGYKHR